MKTMTLYGLIRASIGSKKWPFLVSFLILFLVLAFLVSNKPLKYQAKIVYQSASIGAYVSTRPHELTHFQNMLYSELMLSSVYLPEAINASVLKDKVSTSRLETEFSMSVNRAHSLLIVKYAAEKKLMPFYRGLFADFDRFFMAQSDFLQKQCLHTVTFLESKLKKRDAHTNSTLRDYYLNRDILNAKLQLNAFQPAKITYSESEKPYGLSKKFLFVISFFVSLLFGFIVVFYLV